MKSTGADLPWTPARNAGVYSQVNLNRREHMYYNDHMVHDSKNVDKARDFRKRGFTYSEISKIVGVSKATLSNWLATQSFSKKVRQDNEIKARRDNAKRIALLNRARQTERVKQYQKAQKAAFIEFKHFKSSPLFLCSLGVYLAVGDMGGTTPIRLPSQRKSVHKQFRRFLLEFLGVDNTKIYQTEGLTILNDALAKKKLLVWIDRLP